MNHVIHYLEEKLIVNNAMIKHDNKNVRLINTLTIFNEQIIKAIKILNEETGPQGN